MAAIESKAPQFRIKEKVPAGWRYVEIGRVCVVNYGPLEGKACVIVDIIDHSTALVDGPFSVTGVQRQVMNFRRLTLSPFKLPIGLNAREKSLKKAFEKYNFWEQWKQSNLFKKYDKHQKRASMNDFDRFKLMLLKKTKSTILKKATNKVRKQFKADLKAKKAKQTAKKQ